MLRGSGPGERRGGRSRGTPNRRTILRDRILSIGLDHPAASQRAFLRQLVKDRTLPADTRIAIAPNCFPPKRARSPRTLDALVGVVQDGTANPKARTKAALKITEFLLPKVAKKAKVLPDEYGFSISPKLASAYRDIQLDLSALVKEPTRVIPAIAEKIKTLQARSDAIRRRLQLPCPTKYGDEEAFSDYVRLMGFTARRNNQTALTETQKAEEAHLRARFDVFGASPESIARRRRRALQDAERQYQKRRLNGDFHAERPSRKDRNDLKLLRWLYPEPNPPQLDEFEMYRDHPFEDKLQASDGNFYPRDSKLRPAGAAEIS